MVKERIYLDKTDQSVLWDEITTIDDALTGPWMVKKKYTRDSNPRHNWIEEVCPENNPHIRIQNDNYMLSADGYLMPAKKGQKPPDLRYFDQQPEATGGSADGSRRGRLCRSTKRAAARSGRREARRFGQHANRGRSGSMPACASRHPGYNGGATNPEPDPRSLPPRNLPPRSLSLCAPMMDREPPPRC